MSFDREYEVQFVWVPITMRAPLAIQPAPAIGRPSASGMIMLGVSAACASAADRVAALPGEHPQRECHAYRSRLQWSGP